MGRAALIHCSLTKLSPQRGTKPSSPLPDALENSPQLRIGLPYAFPVYQLPLRFPRVRMTANEACLALSPRVAQIPRIQGRPLGASHMGGDKTEDSPTSRIYLQVFLPSHFRVEMSCVPRDPEKHYNQATASSIITQSPEFTPSFAGKSLLRL